MSSASPRESYNQVFTALENHQNWFARNSIPLIASENIPGSGGTRGYHLRFWDRVHGGLGRRATLRRLRLHRSGGDHLHGSCQTALWSRVCRCRSVSGVNVNLTVYSAFTDPGDTMIAPAIPNGGHISAARKEFDGTAGLVHGLNVECVAFDRDNWNIDVDKTKEKVKKT